MPSFVPVLTSSVRLFVPDEVAPPAPEQKFALPVEWVEHVWLRLREDVECLDAEDTVRALEVARRSRARADALEARALARLNELREGSRYVAEEAALELRVSHQSAQRRIERARRARAGRKVELVADEDAMSTLYLDLPAEVAATAYGLPPTPARCGARCSPIRVAGRRRTSAVAAAQLRPCGNWSRREIASAPTATAPRNAATSTTSPNGAPAVRPAPATAARNANTTTT